MPSAESIDRLSIRERPRGVPLMYQSWRKLLFMHWRLPPERLRPHLPPSLTLDTFDGDAWITVSPFLVRNLRPVFLPPLPWLGSFHEINVRSYVHVDGVPGVWFFSLDADSRAAVLGARLGYLLPYFHARMSHREEGDRIYYSSSRAVSHQDRVEFEANWRKGESVGEAVPGSLEFFLTERYCLYAVDNHEKTYRARIHHPPWKLQRAELMTFSGTMIEAQGLPRPEGVPLLQYAERQDTGIWPLKRVR